MACERRSKIECCQQQNEPVTLLEELLMRGQIMRRASIAFASAYLTTTGTGEAQERLSVPEITAKVSQCGHVRFYRE